ncbi:thioredoxin family protein [Lutispora saccharofermentans]|uniref:Thioredoxin n=1 Tax=Lutispora saccharofermentans TaxID=3024236 RepID=A0ABT1NGT0_9FIRM|nr:thioredoxin family protein [Lutispora saccharofermentans]MCQ1530470.1 thioredoxin family protein [Lutispora saccharofermentans]
MPVIEANAQNFEEVIKEGFAVVDLYGENCNPCKRFMKVIEELEFELPFVNIVKVNTTQNKDIAVRNRVRGVPTILFMKDGKELKRNTGFMELEQLKEVIKEYLY